MRAVLWNEYGSPADVLRIGDIDRPSPGRGEVLVRVHAASIHPGDVFEINGIPRMVRLAAGVRRPKRRSPGRDVAGVVEAIGGGVDGFEAGDEVLGEAAGSLAELVCAPSGTLTHKPDRLTWEQAGATATSGVTALKAIRDVGRVRAGQRVLITGASGGVGTFAVQIAAALGADVTAVAGPDHQDLVRALGPARVLDYTRTDFTTEGDRYDVILDNVCAHTLRESRRALTRGGTLIPNSGSGGGQLVGPLGRILGAALLSGFVGHRLKPFFASVTRRYLDDLVAFITAGSITPVVAATYPLERTVAAVERVASGHSGGKVVIVP